MLCSKCQNIHFKPLMDCDFVAQLEHSDRFPRAQDERNRSLVDLDDFVFYFHHKSLKALKASAFQGCHFCGMLIANIDKKTGFGHSKFFFQHDEVILRRLKPQNGQYSVREWNRHDWIYIHWNDMKWTTTNALGQYVGKRCKCS